MRRKTLLVGALLFSLALSLAACGGGGAESKPAPTVTKAAPTATKSAATATPTPAAASTSPGATGKSELVSIIVYDNPPSFSPSTFNFQKGKTYKLQFSAPKEFHTFTVEALGINIFINSGEAVTQDVTPDKVGAFTMICLPHEAAGMKGQVTVS